MPERHSTTMTEPNEEDVRLARHAASRLDRARSGNGKVALTLSQGGSEETVALPEAALDLLGVIMDELAQGHAVAVAPVESELSTQAAADLLNVSRPYVVGLLESGKLRFRKVGAHRRIRLSDLLEYKARMDAEADRAFAELVEESQRLGLYD